MIFYVGAYSRRGGFIRGDGGLFECGGLFEDLRYVSIEKRSKSLKNVNSSECVCSAFDYPENSHKAKNTTNWFPAAFLKLKLHLSYDNNAYILF